MKKAYIILMFVLGLMLSFVSASTLYSQEGNAGSNLIGGYGKGLYAGYYPNQYSNHTYSNCLISDGSQFEQVAYDYDNDRMPEFVQSTINNIELFTMNCAFKTSINVVAALMPTLTNLNENSYQEITVVSSNASNSIISVNEYDAGSSTWSTLSNISLGYKAQAFACGRKTIDNDASLNQKCFTYASSFNGSRFLTNFTVIDYSGSISSPSMTTYAHIWSGYSSAQINIDLSNFTYTDMTVTPSMQGDGILTLCNQKGFDGVSMLRCIMYDSYGAIYKSVNYTTSLFTGVAPFNFKYYSANIVSISDNDLLLIQIGKVDAGVSNPGYETFVASTSGTVVKTWNDNAGAALKSNTSNFMVSDFNKDGSNELCIMERTNLTCYTYLDLTYPAFATPERYDFYPYILLNNLSFDFTLADYGNYSRLCVAYYGGIICPNTSTMSGDLIFNSSLPVPGFGALDRTTASIYQTGIIVQMPASLHTVYSFTSGTTTNIFRNPSLLAACGDGICQSYESAYSCPSDCLNETTSPVGYNCSSDSDCFQPYPKCLENKCVAEYTGIHCVDDSGCPYNASICYENYCVAGVYGGIPNVTVPGVPTPELDLDQTWRILFAGSFIWRFVVGLILMIVITGKLITAFDAKGAFAVTIIASCLALLTVLQLMPMWVTIFIILIAVAIFILDKVFNKQPSDG